MSSQIGELNMEGVTESSGRFCILLWLEGI